MKRAYEPDAKLSPICLGTAFVEEVFFMFMLIYS